MPSVGSTPTTTSPAQLQQQQQQLQLQQTGQMQYFTTSAQQQQPQTSTAIMAIQSTSMQHIKLQQQHSLPLQLQYQVTTTQPSSAGVFISQTAGIINSTTNLGNNHISGRSSVTASTNSFNSNMGPGGAINGGDISPISSSGSFSSADTNKTILNAIINHQNNRKQQQQQQQQQQQHQQQQQLPNLNKINRNVTNSSSLPTSSRNRMTSSNNQSRSYRTKYSQFMIITPAVSIDRDFGRSTLKITTNHKQLIKAKNKAFKDSNINANNNGHEIDYTNDNYNDNDNGDDGDDRDNDDIIDNDNDDRDNRDKDPYFPNNDNLYCRSMRQSSIDSSNSSDSLGSFRSNYNPYLHTSRQHLLPKSSTVFCVFSPSSWGWCTFLCAAMRCFGTGGNASNTTGGSHTSRSHYSSSFIRPTYQHSRSSNNHTSNGGIISNTPHRRLRSYSTASFTPETAFEHFSAPFKHRRKTRDPLNNITYEL